MDNKLKVKIIGAGLAGCEAALVLANISTKFDVELIEMRPVCNTPVHKTDMFSELVCSNSFKSFKPNSAAGLLKSELCKLGSFTLVSAMNNRVDAGMALAVDRDKFSASVQSQVESMPNIKVFRHQCSDLLEEANGYDALIVATGPMTSDCLTSSIMQLTGQDNLSFYDAAAPIVMADSLNMNRVFVQDRYGKFTSNKSSSGDYINCPMSKEEYTNFVKSLCHGETVISKDFESKDLFQACQPVEEVAKTGVDSLRFGALKPVGIVDPSTGRRPYAVVQLRSENKNKTAYNIVGFQTNLKFGQQESIFRMIPGLENAEFARYGVMHRNTFIDSPKLLDWTCKLDPDKVLVMQGLCDSVDNHDELCCTQSSAVFDTPSTNTIKSIKTPIYFAGQICGTEGYLEAVRSGYHVAISVASKLLDISIEAPSKDTVFGALIDYATDSETKNYQPMHVNFGILPPLSKRIRNKKERYSKYADRANSSMDNYVEMLKNKGLISKQAEKNDKIEYTLKEMQANVT